MDEQLEKCPFCGSSVELKVYPMWIAYARLTNGYYDKFRYVIKCDVCGCTNNNSEQTTINMSEEDAKMLTIKGWNNRC